MSSLAPHIAAHARHLTREARHHCTKAQAEFKTILNDAAIQPRAALYAGLLFVTCVWLAIAVTQHMRNRKHNSAHPNTPNLEKRSPFKAPDRPFGGNFDLSFLCQAPNTTSPVHYLSHPNHAHLLFILIRAHIQPNPKPHSTSPNSPNTPPTRAYSITQFGHRLPSNGPKRDRTQIGRSRRRSHSPTVHLDMGPSERYLCTSCFYRCLHGCLGITLPWACGLWHGMNGLNLIMSF
jgi:hypothetical protein